MSLDRKSPPPVYMMGDLSLPRPVSVTLDNGVRLHYLQGGSQPVNQLDIIWTGGQGEAPAPAVARLCAALMREGTATQSGARISEVLDFNGAMLKIAATWHHTCLSLTSLNSMTANVLPVVADIITNATFDEDNFVKFRDIAVKNLMLSRSRVMTRASEALAPMIKGATHPESSAEMPEHVMAVTSGEVVDFYHRLVSAHTCEAFLSGCLNDAVIDSVCKMLGSLPVANCGISPIIMPYAPEAPARIDVSKPDAMQAAVAIALPAPLRSHPDYLPLRLTAIALGGYFGSRLMRNIREDKGYTYGIMAALMGTPDGSYVQILAEADKAYVDPLIDEVGAELRRLASTPMDDDELMRLKQYVSLSLMENLDSPFAIMDYHKSIRLNNMPDNYFERQVDLVHTITPALVCEMAARYLDAGQMRIAICR